MSSLKSPFLLTPQEMSLADSLTIQSGISGWELMLNAGHALADQSGARAGYGVRIGVLAGPGNNGGDGLVAAERLRSRGYLVSVFLFGDRSKLKGDAAKAAEHYKGEWQDDAFKLIQNSKLIIDALFGAGLSRDLEGQAKAIVEAVNNAERIVISADLPSGIDGVSGQVKGAAIKATSTVTFYLKKPGHLLIPGREYCGHISVEDIGIDNTVLESIKPRLYENNPYLWKDDWPELKTDTHKYNRGHVAVCSGPELKTGASRLSAMAALRAGAGAVTLIGEKQALREHAAHVTAIMLEEITAVEQFRQWLENRKVRSVVLGPGFGIGEKTRQFADIMMRSNIPLVLDADGITSFAECKEDLKAMIHRAGAPAILTPHIGEFSRLFGNETLEKSESKVNAARKAAKDLGAVIVLKGADSVIASPDKRAAIQPFATPWLATAGSGDVLAGIIGSLLAQGMDGFEAACAAVWIHAKAGGSINHGLIADDLPQALPAILKEIGNPDC
jgi:hydroxyethylthiazole kinase-like uncharacterized protein yjeF